MVRRGLVVWMAGVACAWVAVRAGAPNAVTFTYQGQLKQDGVPFSGNADFEVEVFAAPNGPGSSLGDLRLLDVAVENGLFSLDLSFDATLFDGSPRWLGIAVRTPHDPADLTAFTGLEPRQAINATPYALHAFNVPATTESNWQDSGDDVVLPTGNVGVGVSAPEALLHLSRPLADTGLRFQTVRFAEGPPASLVRTPGSTSMGGTGQAWSQPDSARISDDARATVNLAGTAGGADFQQSQSLNLTNLGFALPAQATVVGIQLSIEGQGTCGCSDCDRCVTFVDVELLGGSGPTFPIPISMLAVESTTSVGGTFDLWGLAWTAAQVNDPGFGVRVLGSLGLQDVFLCLPIFGCSYAACDCTGTGSTALDAVSVTVFFYDVSATSAPVNWSLGIPESSSALHLSARADLSSPAIFVDKDGHVGINTTLTGANHLAVSGLAAKSSGPSWSTLSDRRLKRNIEPIPGALHRLLSLRGVTFEFNEEGIATQLAERGRHTGFIAQEVEQVFPEWVGEGGGYQFVTEEGTTALLVEALRELRAEKDNQIRQLAERLERLEKVRAAGPVSP